MNETVDKATDKLMASIQKSQNEAQGNATEAAKTPPAQKAKAPRKTAAKKAAEEVATSTEIETPRKFVGNLRWPD